MAVDLSALMPQQREVATTLDRPLFVSAGAGSGKTFTLTRRILWALDPASGPYVEHLGRVLAITFTKDAAAEIRERVRAALIDAGMDEEALSVDDAWISTIHGMCARILRAYALELGVDPEFSVMGEAEAQELMDQAVDHVLARAEAAVDGRGRRVRPYAELRGWYRLTADGSPFGSAAPNIRDYVRRLLELSCALPHGMDDVHLLRGRIDFSGLRDACRAIVSDFPKAKAASDARAVIDAVDAFEAGEPTGRRLRELMMGCPFPRAQGKARGAVLLMRAEAADAFLNAFVAVGAPALDELMGLARAVEAEYRALKAGRSAMDNNDLLRRTYEAFRDNASIRRAFDGRFKLVMIDEFQDTDQQQVDLIGYLAGEGGRALCTVGDAQQSIYRFRGAEVEVFRRQQAAVAGASVGSGGGAPEAGTLVQLVRNFRSHEEILAYVARVFDGRAGAGGLMPDFLGLEFDAGRKDGLVARGFSRRQALLVAGGSSADRAAAKAAAIARRFRALADAGQPVGGMVLLLGAMSRSDVYARAFRDEGLDCVIAGGSVFSSAPETAAVRALVCALANPSDSANGLAPLLASPMFSLGAQEFLALATAFDPQTGEVRRRNVEVGIMSAQDAPGMGPLPLLDRAREVLAPALDRVGRDPLARIARDVVNASGWFARLEEAGPQGHAVAANVLKALDAVGEAEAQAGNSPRLVALAFDDFLAGKQAPGALNEEGGNAVRIMTVHASKGLEFPVVAVSECFTAKPGDACLQTRRAPGGVEVAALPDQLDGVRLAGGSFADPKKVRKRFTDLYRGPSAWLTPELAEDVSASDSAAARFIEMRDEDARLELAERSRLLYVAMTRARDLLILAMDAKVGSVSKVPTVKFDEGVDLTGRVLERILPEGQSLSADRLVFEGSQPGDFELIALGDFAYGGEMLHKTVGDADAGGDGAGDGPAPADRQAAPGDAAPAALSPSSGPPDTFTLAYPAEVPWRVSPAACPARETYSFSSLAAAPHAEGGDLGDPAGAGAGAAAAAAAADGDPTALGSAFHACAQWLVETGADDVPAARRDAAARLWGCTPAQRERLDAALSLWEGSNIRARALAWPLVRAEVPFFAPGDPELAGPGSYSEGAVDLLCTDPQDRSRALAIDYKTGGSPDETPSRLTEKHALQARVYADALHKAGYAHVTCIFVRVERGDPGHPGEPQTVSYDL